MSDLPPVVTKFGADTTDFKAGIAQLNREIRVIESGFRSTAAAMGEWDKSSDGLQARQEALTKELTLQEKKVSALNTEYQRVAKEKGETSKAAQDLLIRLNRETETLGKMQVELRQTEKGLQEVGKESKDTGKQIKDLGDKAEQTAKKSGGLGNALKVLWGIAKGAALAVAAVATAAAAAAAGIAGIAMGSINAAGELVDLSTKTGFSTTTLQELGYVGGQVGTDLETMTGALARMIRSMDEARQQQQAFDDQLAEGKMEDEISGPMELAQAFNQLGVSFTDTTGQLRDSEVVFGEVIDALGKVSNETERDALSMQIFGRSAMELNPLIKAGADEIAALTEEAHAMGAVMSEDAVYGLEAVGDTLAGLQAGLKGAAGTIAAAMLPGLEGMAGTAQGYMSEFAGIIERSGGNLTRSWRGLGSLFGRIFADIGESAPGMLDAGLAVIQALINAIMTALPQMIPAAIAMITSLVTFILENLPLLMQAGIDIVMALVMGIGPMLPQLITTAAEMIVTLAQGLAAAIPQLLPVIAEIIPQVVLALIGALPLLIEAALAIILALAQGLTTAIPILLPYIPLIMQAIFDALIIALPLIGAAALEILGALAEGIVGALPMLGEVAGEVITTFVQGLQALNASLLEVGKSLLAGIWEGISGNIDWFLEKVMGFFGGLVEKIKGLLGIASPSKVFAGIGENMALGLGAGFDDAFRGVSRGVQNAVDDLSGIHVSAGVTGAGGMVGAAAPVTVVIEARMTNNLDVAVVARQVAEEIQRRRWA